MEYVNRILKIFIKFLRKSRVIIMPSKRATYRVIKKSKSFCAIEEIYNAALILTALFLVFLAISFFIIICVRKRKRRRKVPHNSNIIRLLIRVKYARRIILFIVDIKSVIDRSLIVLIHIRRVQHYGFMIFIE